MYKYKVKTPMAAIRLGKNQMEEHVTLLMGDVLHITSTPADGPHTYVHFQCLNIDYMCAPQVWGDCVERIHEVKVEVAVEVPVESIEESEFFQALQGSLEQAVEIKLGKSDIYNHHKVEVASNDEEYDTFEEKMKYSVADAVARLYEINDRYVRDFQIRLFSDGSMQLRESDEVDAEIVMEFGDEQGFVVGDVHGNIQKWVDMIMDVGFVDYVINHKTSFAARYNLR